MTIEFKRLNENAFAIDNGHTRMVVTKGAFAGLSATVLLKGREKQGISEWVKKTLIDNYSVAKDNRSGSEKDDMD